LYYYLGCDNFGLLLLYYVTLFSVELMSDSGYQMQWHAMKVKTCLPAFVNADIYTGRTF